MAGADKKIEVLSLNPDNISSFSLDHLKKLTKPRYYCYFEGKDPSNLSFSNILVLAALDENKNPVALSFTTVIKQNANLDWFYVDPIARGQGIGTKLMGATLETLKLYKVIALNTYYPLGESFTPSLTKLFQRFKWTNDRLALRCLHFDRTTCHAPWMDKKIPLPKGYSEFNWKKLTKAERSVLEFKLDQLSILPEFSPFRREHLIDYRSSFGIRYQDQVVGYAVNHTVDDETVEFKVLWADPDHLRAGIGFYLVRRTIELVLAQPTPPFAIIYIEENAGNPTWNHFIEKRMLPCTDKVIPIHIIWNQPFTW